MANKKVSQLVSKPSVLVTDLFPIADPTTGQLYKTTISDLGTAIGSGVSSVNGLVGAVVLDTDDIQELASPTNRWFTDTRARAALSASSPLAYNSGTGVFSIPQANGSTNGFLSSADWTTFNAKQAALSGTGFVKISGTTISYDNSTYLTTSGAASTYLALAGGTLTGALNGTSATFSGDLTLSATNPRLYFTDTDNNPDYFISNTDGTFTIYDVTNSTSRLTISNLNTILNTNLRVDGDVLIKQDSVLGGVSGYTAIASDSDGIFLKLGTASAHAYLVLSSLTSFRNFTFPDATGTIALTSNLSSYLPLTGGTLTGGLSGTTGSFSGNVSTSAQLRIEPSGNAILVIGSRSSGTPFEIYNTSNILRIYNGSIDALQIATGAGAVTLAGALSGTSATFSAGVVSQGAYTGFQYNSAGAYPAYNTYFGAIGTNFSNSNSELDIWNTVGGGFVFRRQTGASAQTALLTIANTGAATFSSSVTATQVAIGTTSPATFLHVNGATAALPATSGTSQSAGNRIRLSTAAGTGILDIGCAGGTGMWLQSTDLTDLSLKYPILLNPNGGNVGIGTTSPSQPLEIGGTGNILVAGGGTIFSGAGALFVRAGSGGDLILGANNTNGLMRITSGGNVLIGTTTDAGERLRVSGNLRALSLYASDAGLSAGNWIRLGHDDNVGFIDVNRAINSGDLHFRFDNTSRANINRSTGAYTATSDLRLKTNILDSQNVLSLIDKIKVRSYNWIENNSFEPYGLIAQELHEILPEYVYKPKTEGESWGLSKAELVPVLIKAVQELKAELDTLKNK